MNSSPSHRHGFTLMEILVVLAIIVVLFALAVPVFSSLITRGYQAAALTNMRNLGTAFVTFAGDNNGRFPIEDAPGSNSWDAAARPENQTVWYNALPHILGQRTVGEFAAAPRAYYLKSNVLFLPGAKYPVGDSRLERPLFAIAMNSRLQRKNAAGIKPDGRLPQVAHPSTTVLFFEQGLKDEKKSYGAQGRYDGAPKGTARSFVARYNGKGVLCFLDGHAAIFKPADLLTETGALPFPQLDVSWTLDPEVNPN
ncbi:MAG: type II secretion system protein [Chthoniobacterales bacterium]